MLGLMRFIRERLWTPENRWAAAVCLLVVILIIVTADSSPLWIYQGF